MNYLQIDDMWDEMDHPEERKQPDPPEQKCPYRKHNSQIMEWMCERSASKIRVCEGRYQSFFQCDWIKQRQGETMERGRCLKEALKIINGERQDQYGNPEDSFKLIAEYWNAYINKEQEKTLIKYGFDPADYTLANMLTARHVMEMMMLFKIARMSGQKTKIDNYTDLAGYAGIAGDMVEVTK